ncbi:MAG TPA: DUF1540 domain-containing protein [Ruminococcaceae bacterium]|nr:DUF1540 domain-containing protein [Oscillospiraceae bacterium]
MDAPSMKVKCEVDCCDYNQSKMCHAQDLKVSASNHKNDVHTSDETCCDTFISHSAK